MEKSENNQSWIELDVCYEETGTVTVTVDMQATALDEIVALEILKDKLEEEIRYRILRKKSERIFEHLRKIAEELGYAHLSGSHRDELAE